MFKLEDELTVSSSGQFSFSFLKTSSDIEYKLVVSGVGYKSTESIMTPGSIVAGEENKVNQNLVPFGVVVFKLKSGSNSTTTDEFLFNFKNDLEGGESYVNQFYLGSSVDTMLKTEVIAEKYNKFNYILKRNGMLLNVSDSVFCSKGNTTPKNIIY